MKKQFLDWTVGFVSDPEDVPREMVPALVPGAVQLDWARAHQWPDYRYDMNFRDYRWMEDCYWIYRALLKGQKLQKGESLWLVCGGIDYEYDIKVNGTLLLHQEGMFRPVNLDITQYGTEDAAIEIMVYPVPKDRTGAKDTREEARQSVKPAAAYGWDWHPRLIPLGIWEELYIEKREGCYMESAKVEYSLSEDLAMARVRCVSYVHGEELPQWTIRDPHGEVIFSGSGCNVEFQIIEPELWWCNGYGTPALYAWNVSLPSGSEKSGKVGFRVVKLTMNEGAWTEMSDFPKTRSVPPITLTLNHQVIFSKGTNLVNPEIFPGTVTRETYEPIVRLAKEAHMNLFRCWGGAYIDKESFFELCDESGIMVWQEFPLACNDYYDSEHYLKVLESEAAAIIQRLAPHPCLVLWCGGNELFNNWSGMDEQKLALRLLNKLCYELDRQRPFIMTSPLMGMGHGSYLFRYQNGEEVFHAMQRAHNTAYTEFGVPSISDREYLLRYLPEDKVEPFEPNESLVAHHAFGAWIPKDMTWSCVSTIEEYFGKSESLEDLIQKSQWMQCEGYKGIFEEARRQKPYCSMALNWCFNEPWPTAANNSVLNYPAEPKPAYEAIKQSLQPSVASARIPKFTFEGGEMFSVELWILNDGLEGIDAGHMDVYLEIGQLREKIFAWDYPEVKAGKNLLGPTIHYEIPHCSGNWLRLTLEAGKLSNSYLLHYKSREDRRNPVKLLNT